MKSKILSVLMLSVFIVAVFTSFVSAVTLAEWDLTTDGAANPATLNSDVTAGTFGSSGVISNGFDVDGANAEDWSLISSVDTAKYFEVTISPTSGNELTITDIDFDYLASITGPAILDFEYSTQSNFASPISIVTENDVSTADKTSSNTGLSIAVDDGETLTLRWFGYDFNADTNEFFVNDLIVLGSATAVQTTFCSNGAINEIDGVAGDIKFLELTVDINNLGEGDDERWQPLDLIEIEVEFDNKNDRFDFDGDGDKDDGDGDLDDVTFELALYEDSSLSTNVIDDMIWISKDDEEFEVGNIDEDEDDRHVFEFRVDPGALDDGDYILMVKAYPKGDEDETCIDYSNDLSDSDFGSSEFYAEIEIEKENDAELMVVVDKDSYPEPIDAFCGSQVSFTVDVWNIGEDDFEDQILVHLENKLLDIKLDEIATGDLDAGDDTQVFFTFDVPSDAEEKTYTLAMRVFYDYDEDDDNYDEISEDTFNAYLNVGGNCAPTSSAIVTASLESGGEAGESMIVKATITNTGDSSATYIVNPTGYSLWANSASPEPSSFILNAGESKDVLITLDVKEDASGSSSFDLEVVSGNELVVRQPVTVTVEPKTGFFTGGVIGTESALAWGMGILSIVLIVAIIIVLIRLRR